jgi:hypothetical protein
VSKFEDKKISRSEGVPMSRCEVRTSEGVKKLTAVNMKK